MSVFMFGMSMLVLIDKDNLHILTHILPQIKESNLSRDRVWPRCPVINILSFYAVWIISWLRETQVKTFR